MAALADTALTTLSTDETDPRARGLAAGSALAERAALCLAAYLPLFASVGHDLDDVRRFGARVLERTASWHAPLAVELEAFALGARLEPELVGCAQRAHRAARARRVHDRRALRERGGPVARAELGLVRRRRPQRCLVWSAAVEGARFATMTEAGILAKVGVSTRGIAVALNILYHASDGTGRARRARAPRPAATAGGGGEHRRRLGAAARDAVLGLQLRHRGRRRRRWRVLRAVTRPASRASSRATACSPTPITSSTTRWREARPSSPPHGCPARAGAWRPRERAGAARTRRRARAARRPRVRSAGDLPPRRAVPESPTGRSSTRSCRSPCARECPELRVAAGQPCECAFLSYAV